MAERRAAVKLSEKFLREYKGLPEDLYVPVNSCLSDIAKEPIPQGRRMHSVTHGGERPKIFTVDVLSNHSWKLSYMKVEQTIWVLRVATHRQMDRDPGRAEARRLMDEFS